MEPPFAWKTRVMPANRTAALNRALQWLRQGQVVAFPTDTVYGVGVRSDDVGAVARLYEAKGRPRTLALPLLLAEAADMELVCRDIPPAAWRLAERFWPGGLTLVLWRGARVPDLVSGGRPTVGVRQPDHPLPRELARQLGVPLASSSANLSGGASPAAAPEVLAQLAGRIPLVLDGGPCRAAQPSTVLDLTVEPPAILRRGPIRPEEIAEVLELVS